MKITAIEITHHRLPLDPPFRPSWDFRPREKFEATIVRVKTDEGLEGIGSGDTMTGLCRPRASLRRPGSARHRAPLAHPRQHPVPLRPLLAARPRALGSCGQDRRAAGLAAARRALRPRAGLRLLGDAARFRRDGGGGGKLSRARLSRAEAPLPSRRLARRHPRARSGAQAHRRQARADGRLQSGLAHEPRRRAAVDAERRAPGRARAGAARRLLDGGAAASRRPQRACARCARWSTSASPAAR